MWVCVCVCQACSWVMCMLKWLIICTHSFAQVTLFSYSCSSCRCCLYLHATPHTIIAICCSSLQSIPSWPVFCFHPILEFLLITKPIPVGIFSIQFNYQGWNAKKKILWCSGGGAIQLSASTTMSIMQLPDGSLAKFCLINMKSTRLKSIMFLLSLFYW